MRNIALLVFTDGRDDLLARTIFSIEAKLIGPVEARLIIDDTGDESHAELLEKEYGPRYKVSVASQRLGFAGTIQRAWNLLKPLSPDYIWHHEDDMVLRHNVHLSELATLLERHRYLQQVALKRQPWNEEELEAGDFMKVGANRYINNSDQLAHWVEQRAYFTTNPSLYRFSLTERGWPQEQFSEGKFGLRLMDADATAAFAFWGRTTDDPWVNHIGDTRNGTGY